MKTKIIYISGGEVFSPAEIRAAFDEVRAALQIGKDTIMFGVSVDENILEVRDAAPNVIEDKIIKFPAPAEEAVEEKPAVADKPKPKRKKKESVIPGREASPESEMTPEITPVPAPATQSLNRGGTQSAKTDGEGVAPILSVIGAVSEPDEDYRGQVSCAQGVEDIRSLRDAAPMESIEDIFNGISPIAEDNRVDITSTDENEDILEACIHPAKSSISPGPGESAPGEDIQPLQADDDAALYQLASEYVAAQDTLPAEDAPKLGRINKLKNVLPFKKKEKAESSLLGDLFGWAGVAANDEADGFSMPDFFQVGNR
ncbi:MAG: hypothetical protein FWE17_03055 [Alphaproteobacteria bacterium]|nr:hypothetical protein [Alphaproteobacteria bacterium]MCL2758167.1 hypothetical protein [Alphaproteobacteria bacterium]